MILEALVRYYETLAEDEKVSKPGWCTAKISYALELAKDGTLRGIIPLKQEEERGKKTVQVPVQMKVPQMAARSSGINANFLCDNSKYLLGIDKDGSGKRVQECFLASKERHLQLLEEVHSEAAEAVKAFFLTWQPEKAAEHPDIAKYWEDLTAGGNLIFDIRACYAQEDREICEAWEKARTALAEGKKGRCLVTGKATEIERIHGTIKGVQGAQSSGAALVSFNAPAFESYGKEQSYNAPVGKYAVFAYTTALNYLLSQRKYVFTFGDVTVVFWAENGEESYQAALWDVMEPGEDNQEIVKGVFEALKKGAPIAFKDMKLNMNQRFYILGLSPNAARLSVRFFYQDSFGNILKNMEAHYERLQIVKPLWKENIKYLGIHALLSETVNQKSKEKKPQPNMAAGLFRSVFSDINYPESLYSNTLIRIRAEQGKEKISYGRAAIIKAYLMKNKGLLKEGNYVTVNEKTESVPYVLGRVFAVLEEIQKKAHGKFLEKSSEKEQGRIHKTINTTIKDKYYNAACATPACVFPVLIKLKNSHIRKMEKNEGERFEEILGVLFSKVEKFPKTLTLYEQGEFILGYYHQVQKRDTKKEEQ